MRKYGVPEPYEKLKALTRGNTIRRDDLERFVAGLDIPPDAKNKLLQLTPETYTGLAAELAKDI
jgi:adenylosuccinate lyase